MKSIVMFFAIVGVSCNAWQGTNDDRSSDWTWVCGEGDDDTSSTRADGDDPDGGS